ncbi:MAG: Na/Pi cotransporter family protein [Rhodospirillaceae bacterium]|nr:Na/Pi cotransporter family protein [Rhodospirillaceae bacterium]
MNGAELLLNIAGGVALLLWGVRMVRTGILRAWGSDFRRVLASSLRNPFKAWAAGLGVTTLLQSSTATASLAVSFASKGLVTTAAGLALMLGADVGSTLVVQLLSFGISWLSPVLILIGVVAFLATESGIARHVGRALVGLGLVLLSLSLIVGASEPLRDSEAMQTVLTALGSEPVIALLVAALLTWLAHSSVAMVLFVMSLVGSSVVPLELGFVLVLGANAGAGIVPFVLSLAEPPTARRIPLGNLLFRVIGALIALPFLALAAPYIAEINGGPARQIANFHTAFNLALTILFLPLTGLAAKLVDRLLPDTREVEGTIRARYLDPDVIKRPSLALAAASREVLRMADIVETMLRELIGVFRDNDPKLIDRISQMDDDVDTLYEAIKLYLTEASRAATSEEESRRLIDAITFTTNLEHVGDIIDKNLLELAQKKIRNRLSFSAEGWKELETMHGRVVDNMQLALGVYMTGDVDPARQLLAQKEMMRELERAGSEHHLERLRSGRVQSIETSALHLDIMRDLKRINSHLTSVAYPILDAHGELRKSRLRSQPSAPTADATSDKAAEAGRQRPTTGT